MSQSNICIGLFFLLTITLNALVAGAQSIDTDFCDINQLPSGPIKLDPPEFGLDSRYQARIEKNSRFAKETVELTQYYDGKENTGVSISRFADQLIRQYNYFDTDELFLVKDNKCTKFRLSESIMNELSDFLLIPDGDGKEKIASLLTLVLSSRSVELVYIGYGNFIRGIPVNEWQTCIYSNFDKKSLKVTLSFSRPEVWKPAYPLGDNSSIPVQILIESKDSNGVEDTVTYTFTQFRPFLDADEEEKEHLIPRGIYCQDKINTKELPLLPNSFRYESQIVAPTAFQNSDNKVDISSSREEYNYNLKLFRFDFYKDNGYSSAIFDFNTGVKYIFSSSGECTLYKIDVETDFKIAELNKDGLIQMKSASNFFHFDGGNYQYSGSRSQEGVDTDVWIGKSKIKNKDVNVEWYFMSQSWNNTDQASLTPILMRVLQEVKAENGTVLIRPTSKYFFNFGTKNQLLRDYDLSVCKDQQRRKSFYVEFDASSIAIKRIKNNIIQFTDAFASIIEGIAKITPLRLADITVDYDENLVLVYFNLFERLKSYGKVAFPKNDVSLDAAVETLRNYFRQPNNIIEFTFKSEMDGIVKISAVNSTFAESKGQVINAGFNSGSIAAVTIMSLLIGMLFAILLVSLQKFQKINLPFLK